MLPFGEPIHPCSKNAAFIIMCDCNENDDKFSKALICVKLLQ